MPNFSGTYKVDKSESDDTEAYFRAKGVPDHIIETMKKGDINFTINQDNDNFHVKVTNNDKVLFDKTFKINEEFEHTRPNGEVVKMKFYWDGDKLVDESIDSKGKKEIVSRTPRDDGSFVVTSKYENLTSTRVFKKI